MSVRVCVSKLDMPDRREERTREKTWFREPPQPRKVVSSFMPPEMLAAGSQRIEQDTCSWALVGGLEL